MFRHPSLNPNPPVQPCSAVTASRRLALMKCCAIRNNTSGPKNAAPRWDPGVSWRATPSGRRPRHLQRLRRPESAGQDHLRGLAHPCPSPATTRVRLEPSSCSTVTTSNWPISTPSVSRMPSRSDPDVTVRRIKTARTHGFPTFRSVRLWPTLDATNTEYAHVPHLSHHDRGCASVLGITS